MFKKITVSLLRLALCAIAMEGISYSLQAEIKLPPFFGDGMVLQRDGAAPLWGTASPGEAIKAELNGQVISATADNKGSWSSAFKGLKAGGPFTLTIKGNSDKITLSNVLVGDVWLCSGQSNMVYTLGDMGALAKDDIAAANDPQMRWFVPKTYIVDDPYQGRTWAGTTPSTVPGDSAMAFYFGRSLRQKLNVPVGILEVAFPGSAIEGWFSPEGLESLGMGPESKALTDQYTNLETATPKFLSDMDAWEKTFKRQDPGNKGFAQGWADPKANVSDWKSIPNIGDWSSLSLNNGGVVWVRKSIDMPAATVGKDLDLMTGYLRDEGKEFGNILGTVYFNNHKVGTIGDVLKHIYTAPDQVYFKVPGNLVVAGTNVVAVRFFTQEQKAPWRKTELQLKAADKKTALPTVTPDWLAKVEAELPPLPQEAAASRPVPPPSPPEVRLPSFFYNYMLKQVAGYGIKGAIWYQGEANTETFGGAVPSVLGNYPPVAYRKLLPALISNWRQLWNQDDLPFYIVQLPNTNTHNKPSGQPEKSDWAALRESQLLTWKAVPHTGMIVTIDLGNGDLHPPDKKPFGERMALVALANAYGQKVDFSGPVYDSMAVEGNKIRLKFKYTGGGLTAKNGPLKEFAIAGGDKKFVWADAVVDGDNVVVSSQGIASPVAVRYAWADNPANCNLCNKEGLPASPFRTDDWPLH
jgi:sialate O-acetylesterase